MVLRRGLLLAPLLAVYSLGCRQTHLETGVSPESALGGLRRERVRLTVVDGRHLQLREPKITGDSVRGTSTRTGDYSGAVALD